MAENEGKQSRASVLFPNCPDGSDSRREDPRSSVVRVALPACQPQEGSIGSQITAFTQSELAELKAALPSVEFRPRQESSSSKNTKTSDMLNICQPWEKALQVKAEARGNASQA